MTHAITAQPSVKRFALCYWPLSCSVCNVGVLWPNGWMDQDETWHRGRPRGPGHIVLDGDPAPPKGHRSPNFRPMSVVTKWIKMPLGMEVDLSPGHFVLDGDLACPPKGHSSPSIFCPMSIVAKRSSISATTEHLF